MARDRGVVGTGVLLGLLVLAQAGCLTSRRSSWAGTTAFRAIMSHQPAPLLNLSLDDREFLDGFALVVDPNRSVVGVRRG